MAKDIVKKFIGKKEIDVLDAEDIRNIQSIEDMIECIIYTYSYMEGNVYSDSYVTLSKDEEGNVCGKIKDTYFYTRKGKLVFAKRPSYESSRELISVNNVVKAFEDKQVIHNWNYYATIVAYETVVDLKSNRRFKIIDENIGQELCRIGVLDSDIEESYANDLERFLKKENYSFYKRRLDKALMETIYGKIDEIIKLDRNKVVKR